MAELDSQPKSIQSIYTWYSEDSLWVNRRYQRKLVWTLAEKQKLVESVLKKYPIPAVLLAERDSGGYEVIDGLQRIHTLMSFIEGGFTMEEGSAFDWSQFPTANTRLAEGAFEPSVGDAAKLSAREVGSFLDYSLAVSVMRGATDSDIDDVFARINTYGHRLSDQERRQAGVQNQFSQLVRELSCTLRGDVSSETLKLAQMPEISIDLPMTKHGYQVLASQVFWVEQGILRSTDLRDSMDEQCIADIAASVIGGGLIPRSKDALDEIYERGSEENARIEDAVSSYGADRFSAEFNFVLDEIRSVCDAGESGTRLRSLLFSRQTTNPFPAIFAVVFIAFHELLIGESQKISDYEGLRSALANLDRRVDTSRGSTTPGERRQNVNTVQGLVRPFLVPGKHEDIYGDHAVADIDAMLRRSEIEASHYELKQGILQLDDSRELDDSVLSKVVKTIAAIANNGKERAGTLLIGVADSPQDADRVKHLYGTEARLVGRKHVVGVRREAEHLDETVEDYVARIKNSIRNADLSEPLKGQALASMSFSEYFGYGVVIIGVPAQAEVSTLDGKVYIRQMDDTVEVSGADILAVAKRF